MATVPRLFARVSLVGWMVGVVVGATLQARHLLALPTAVVDQRVRDESVAHLRPAGRNLAVWHVLAAGCACSRRIVQELAARPQMPGTIETGVWVAMKGSERPRTGAMRSLTMTPAEHERRFVALTRAAP